MDQQGRWQKMSCATSLSGFGTPSFTHWGDFAQEQMMENFPGCRKMVLTIQEQFCRCFQKLVAHISHVWLARTQPTKGKGIHPQPEINFGVHSE